jgi:hypothetical protein
MLDAHPGEEWRNAVTFYVGTLVQKKKQLRNLTKAPDARAEIDTASLDYWLAIGEAGLDEWICDGLIARLGAPQGMVLP